MVTVPDYKIRYVNQVLKSSFGEGVGSTCYSYLGGANEPCRDCRLGAVIERG